MYNIYLPQEGTFLTREKIKTLNQNQNQIKFLSTEKGNRGGFKMSM